MRVIKHGFLSLIRKPIKAIMIFVILLVVYSLVFTGIIIQNSVRSSKEYVRKELGAVVEMKADFKKAIENFLPEKDFIKLKLPSALAEEMAKDRAVKQVYMTSYVAVSGENLISGTSMLESVMDSNGSNIRIYGDYNTDDGTTNFSLAGCNTDVPLEFNDETYILTQGRFRNEDDKGKDTILITEEFASANNLTVGDTVDLTSGQNHKTYAFEIIGIYGGKTSYKADEFQTSLESVQKLMIDGKDAEISSVNFLLEDPQEVEEFITRHETQLPNDFIYLYSNDSEYKTLTRPLDIISTIISILLMIVFIAGVIIMLSIITMFVRERRFEIGLLLSSGEGKIKIFIQFIFEILIISVIAFTAAAGVSRLTADNTAAWIVENQLVEDDTRNPEEGISINFDKSNEDTLEIEDVAKDFDVAIDLFVIRNLLLVSLGIVIFSAGAPLLIIFGYKPRESLQN